MKRGYTLCSFDVKSLFTKIPIQFTLSAMKKKLLNDTSWQTRTKLELEDIIMLTELCMEGNYFEYKQMYFEQLEGAAMG